MGLIKQCVDKFGNSQQPGPRTWLVIAIVSAILGLSLAANAYLSYKVLTAPPKLSSNSVIIDEAVVMHTKGGLLEVSTVKATETFDISQEHSFATIPFGKTTARIRTPAHYRYHIELDPEWKFSVRNGTFVVVAPAVKPSLPVAIDTSKLEADSGGRWSFITGDSVIKSLQRTITDVLGKKAASPMYIGLQRDTARKTVTEFVSKWLLTQERWKSVRESQIHVFFADETIQSLAGLPLPQLPETK